MQIIRLPKVRARTGLGTTTIYRKMSEGTFPRQIQLGPNSVGWDEAEVDAWVAARPRGPLGEPEAVKVRRRQLETAHVP